MPGTPRGRRGSSVTARPKLTADAIVQAGLEVAAASRSGVFSAKELGEKIGADPTSIYRHFKNKGHLLQMMLDELTARCVASVTAPPEEWRDRLRQLANTTLDEFCAHPSVIMELTTLTTHGPGEADAVELVLDAFTRAGLSSSEIVQHYALFSLQLISSATTIARRRSEEHGADLADDADAFRAWFDAPHSLNLSKHPRTVELSAQIARLDERDLFRRGVEAVIESAESRVVPDRVTGAS